MFQNKVVVVTGGANGIGKCISEEFARAGAKVCVIDVAENPSLLAILLMKRPLCAFLTRSSRNMVMWTI